MPQSSDDKTPKTAEEILFEIPDSDNTDKTTQYFGIAIQSIWTSVIGMVEHQRRMSKQLQTLRHNYNRLLDTTNAMLAVINSPHDNPVYHKKKSNAAQILLENSQSVGQNILPESGTSIPSLAAKVALPQKTKKDDDVDKNIKNLWKRK